MVVTGNDKKTIEDSLTYASDISVLENQVATTRRNLYFFLIFI